MVKKKSILDTSFLDFFMGLKFAGTEDNVDYYHIAINQHAAFVIEIDHASCTADLLLTPISVVDEEFLECYFTGHKDVVFCDLQTYQTRNWISSAIKTVVQFTNTYKNSPIPYSGILEMIRIAINKE